MNGDGEISEDEEDDGSVNGSLPNAGIKKILMILMFLILINSILAIRRIGWYRNIE